MSGKTFHKRGLGRWLSRQSWVFLVIMAVALWVIFAVIDSNFGTLSNTLTLLNSIVVMAIVGTAASMIMATGEMDFSIGNQMSIASMVIGTLLAQEAFNNYVLAFLLTLLVGAAIGLFNSLLHVGLGMPAFIATLGTSTLLEGIGRTINDGQNMHNLAAWPDEFTFLGQSYAFNVIPMPVIVLAIISFIIVIYSEKTKWGRSLYAVGANARACDYLGISAKAQKVRGFVLCSILTALAGILQGSMYNVASKAMGSSVLLEALTVIMLGATIKGGVFNVPGTILASVIMGVLSSGLVFIGWYGDSANAVKGAVLIISMLFVVVSRRRISKG